jgi:hypothetical protein
MPVKSPRTLIGCSKSEYLWTGTGKTTDVPSEEAIAGLRSQGVSEKSRAVVSRTSATQ